MKKAFKYLRVSKARGRDQMISPEIQEAQINRVGDLHNLKFIDKFIDLDFSGRNVDRPEFQKMLSRLEEVDAVVFYRLDRFTRSLTDFVNIYKLCKEKDVQLISSTETLDTSTPMGEAMTQVISVFAQLESANLSARVSAAHDYLAAEGKPASGIAPYGYIYDQQEKKFLVNKPEADVVKWIFKKFALGGTMWSIVQELNMKKIPTRKGKPWVLITISTLLKNSKYVGLRKYKGKLYPSAEPSILSKELWTRAQARRRYNKTVPSRLREPKYMLSGLVRCAECGYRMHVSATKIDPDPKKKLDCAGYKTRGKSVCPGNVIKKHLLDKVVEEKFFSRINEDYLTRKIISSEREAQKTPGPEVEKLKKDLQDVDRKIERLHQAFFVQGVISERDFKRTNNPLQKQRDYLQAQLQKFEDQKVLTPDPKSFLHVVTGLKKRWDQLNPAQKNRILNLFIDHIVVEKGTKKIEGRKKHVKRGDQRIKIVWREGF